MDTKIPQETKDLWLPLLESGELTQARCALYNDGSNGYCCLGLYAKACGASFYRETCAGDPDDDGEPTETETDVKVMVDGEDINACELLDQDFADRHGISSEVQELLSNLNDGSEHTISREHPMFAVWLKHALEEKAALPGKATLVMPKYNFAQIAQVIREDL